MVGVIYFFWLLRPLILHGFMSSLNPLALNYVSHTPILVPRIELKVFSHPWDPLCWLIRLTSYVLQDHVPNLVFSGLRNKLLEPWLCHKIKESWRQESSSEECGLIYPSGSKNEMLSHFQNTFLECLGRLWYVN